MKNACIFILFHTAGLICVIGICQSTIVTPESSPVALIDTKVMLGLFLNSFIMLVDVGSW